MTISYKRNRNFFLRFVDGEFEGTSFPDDMANPDRQALQEWLDAGNEVEEIQSAAPEPSVDKWKGLAAAFKLSELNGILKGLKDAGDNPKVNAIWRISDDLTLVILNDVFSDDIRTKSMTQEFIALFQKLEEGEVVVPDSARIEIREALERLGFDSVVEALSRNSVV